MFLSEDLTNETMETQKAQLDKLKEAKRAGKMAYFVLDILVIKDRRRVESSQVLLFIYLLPYNPLSNNMSLNALQFSYLDDNEFAAVI